jgi:hypothetical protein
MRTGRFCSSSRAVASMRPTAALAPERTRSPEPLGDGSADARFAAGTIARRRGQASLRQASSRRPETKPTPLSSLRPTVKLPGAIEYIRRADHLHDLRARPRGLDRAWRKRAGVQPPVWQRVPR